MTCGYTFMTSPEEMTWFSRKTVVNHSGVISFGPLGMDGRLMDNLSNTEKWPGVALYLFTLANKLSCGLLPRIPRKKKMDIGHSDDALGTPMVYTRIVKFLMNGTYKDLSISWSASSPFMSLLVLNNLCG